MQSMPRASLLLAVAGGAAGQSSDNPMAKVLQLLDDLSAKITNDGEKEAKAYHEYFEWCDETSQNTAFAIKTAEASKAKLEAKIDKLSSDIEAAGAQIEELAGSIATDQKELDEATLIRKKEEAEFKAGQSELVETIDMVGRAIDILSKEMAKNPAAFAQIDTSNGVGIVKALSVVLDAASFSVADQTKLAAFVQSQSQETDEDDDMELNAPAAAAYKSHSGGIVDTLEDLKDKAEQQLGELRKAEVNRKHNFDMLKQSLEDQISADTKTMEDEKAVKSSAGEGKATAEGDLEVTNKDLTNGNRQLKATRQGCVQVAADHENSITARKEELKVIAEARKTLQESSGGAVSQSYSFLQMQTQTERSGPRVVAMVRRLAKKQHSSALAQLASQIASAMKMKSSGGDPFGKVKGLIRSMIARLEKEAGEDAAEKAYCDEQMAKTAAKKEELEEDVAKQTSRIDQAMTRAAQLRGEIKAFEAELGALAKEQAELDAIRHESHADYETAKADLEKGLSGVRQAINLLTQYYSAGTSMLQDDADDTKFGAFMQQPAPPENHQKSKGAGEGIINILQVVESDFADDLAKEEAEEADAQSEYEKVSQDNAVTKTEKDQGVKYKTQEAKAQDKTAADYRSDHEATSAELSAVLEYFGKIKARCIAKPETYAKRKERREAEIKGLKEALSILRDETALVQQRKGHGSFRGTTISATTA